MPDRGLLAAAEALLALEEAAAQPPSLDARPLVVRAFDAFLQQALMAAQGRLVLRDDVLFRRLVVRSTSIALLFSYPVFDPVLNPLRPWTVHLFFADDLVLTWWEDHWAYPDGSSWHGQELFLDSLLAPLGQDSFRCRRGPLLLAVESACLERTRISSGGQIMGLEMYLNRTAHPDAPRLLERWNALARLAPFESSLLDEVRQEAQRIWDALSLEEMGYWYKAIAIHRWFVDRVQDGVDDYRLALVPYSDLRTLRDTVVTVLAHPERAPDLLPMPDGFAVDHDEYRKDLQRTLTILNPILADPDSPRFTWVYNAYNPLAPLERLR
ncbi:protein of unknown function [Candidatus Hydrogenisulfobacillus filiaventi]|uniref:Uncharacterized protein n=1 Tax=Candidatus Hydrogenisulfobacillus filiaventi TaxID=2707344 RepID=A0A6F8ZIL0_9FIRM|nr:protein of unknown function [Candidatus Hydrogenisulfobacillus filiaventi]